MARIKGLYVILALAILFMAAPSAHTVTPLVITGVNLPGIGGFRTLVVYYGWLNTSNLLSVRFDILVFAGSSNIMNNQYSIISALMSRGVEAYAYIHDDEKPIGLGSYYNYVVNGTWTGDEYVAYIEGLIDNYVGRVTGVFLDECDPGYFGRSDPSDPYVAGFTQALENIVYYAHSRGLKVFINGVRAYAGLGDYYLWEDFITYPSGDGYAVDVNFYSTSSGNPYEWVNGIAKYEYLSDHGLLNKTIALSFADPRSPDLALLGYYMSRILGLAGWGFADKEIYSAGGPIATVQAVPLGYPVTDPQLGEYDNTASRIFTAGKVYVDLAGGRVTHSFPVTREPEIDGEPDPGYTEIEPTTLAPGAYSYINKVLYAITPNALYLYVNASWSDTGSGGLIHVYIDADNDPGTGYSINGIGADYLLETLTDNYTELAVYTGTGSDWSWERVDTPVYSAVWRNGYKAYEYGIDVRNRLAPVFKVIVATMHDWDDDEKQLSTISNQPTIKPTPSIYTVPDKLVDYGYAVIEDVGYNGTTIIMKTDAPSGKLARYTVYLPFPVIEAVYKNDTPLPRKQSLGSGEGYTVESHGTYSKLTIQVKHSSPVIITVKASNLLPAPEPSIAPLLTIVVVTVLLAFAGKKIKK